MPDFTMSRHALERALDMAVDGSEIRNCFENPEQIWWSVHHESWTYQRGRIALGVSDDAGVCTVLTVLWATPEAWEEDARVAPLNGRELRGIAKWKAARHG